jgi:hypothetical protein
VAYYSIHQASPKWLAQSFWVLASIWYLEHIRDYSDHLLSEAVNYSQYPRIQNQFVS